ncbi:MAG: glycosyl hydrolase family 28-related protein [Bacteroidota bacterium]|nr:glycosyl hydrolase family 28-related protein [Bacteroidota bacterium]
MMKKVLLFCFSTMIFSPVFAQTWRSSLYPENWMPGMKDSQGRFLHDFSYAGYRSGDVPLPEITANILDVTKSPYFADKTGGIDARAAIQLALDDAGKAGGGVVYLPEGTFKIDVSVAANNPIKINYSNVVLRGAGTGKTFIFNENPNVRGLSVITVRPVTGGDWVYSGTNTVNITTD